MSSAKTAEQTGTCCLPAPVHVDDSAAAGQVQALSALADPTRLRIVEILARLEQPLCVCEIQSAFTLGQPTISHHLRILREAGLVATERRGLWVYYSLNRGALAQAGAYLERLVGQAALPAR